MNPQPLVKKFIIDNFLFGDDGDLRDDVSLIDQGIIDSTGVLELVVFLEETFRIKILDEEMTPENLESIVRISCFVSGKSASAAPVPEEASLLAGS